MTRPRTMRQFERFCEYEVGLANDIYWDVAKSPEYRAEVTPFLEAIVTAKKAALAAIKKANRKYAT